MTSFHRIFWNLVEEFLCSLVINKQKTDDNIASLAEVKVIIYNILSDIKLTPYNQRTLQNAINQTAVSTPIHSSV